MFNKIWEQHLSETLAYRFLDEKTQRWSLIKIKVKLLAETTTSVLLVPQDNANVRTFYEISWIIE